MDKKSAMAIRVILFVITLAAYLFTDGVASVLGAVLAVLAFVSILDNLEDKH